MVLGKDILELGYQTQNKKEIGIKQKLYKKFAKNKNIHYRMFFCSEIIFNIFS